MTTTTSTRCAWHKLLLVATASTTWSIHFVQVRAALIFRVLSVLGTFLVYAAVDTSPATTITWSLGSHHAHQQRAPRLVPFDIDPKYFTCKSSTPYWCNYRCYSQDETLELSSRHYTQRPSTIGHDST
eukprot:4304817-Amphidinium_carterae.1